MSRDAKTVVLVHGSKTIRAGLGVHHELLQKPSIELTARVGLAASTLAQGTAKSDDYIVGKELDDRIEAGEEGLAVIWPMRKGRVLDWQAMIALWRHVLFRMLPIKRSRNDSPVLLCLPAPISRAEHAILTQIFFEHLNAPAFCLVETPLLSAYAVGVLSAAVVDVGFESCSVTPVLDCLVQHASIQRCNIGTRHCALYLAHLLRRDSSLTDALVKLSVKRSSSASLASSSKSDVEAQLHDQFLALATQLIEEGHCSVPVNGKGEDGAEAEPEEETFDVAAALVAGREKAAIEEQERRNKAALEASRKNEEAMDAAAAVTEGDADPSELPKPIDTAGNDEEDKAKRDAAETASQAEQDDDVQPGATEDEDAVTLTFRGLRLRVAPGPLQQAAEPLFDPAVLAGVRGADPSFNAADLGVKPLGDGAEPGSKVDSALIHANDLPFHPSTSPSLPDTIASAIAHIPASDRRAGLWESLVVTGATIRGLKGLTPALTGACSKHIAGSAASGATGLTGYERGAGGSGPGGAAGLATGDSTPGINDFDAPGTTYQPTNVRSLRVPDYFAEYKGAPGVEARTDLAPFLGASIYAKLIFDPHGRNYVTKASYNEKGPSAIFAVTVQ